MEGKGVLVRLLGGMQWLLPLLGLGWGVSLSPACLPKAPPGVGAHSDELTRLWLPGALARESEEAPGLAPLQWKM